MDDELRDRIVKGLVRQRSQSDIIEEVCVATGLDWPRVEKLVRQVESEQAHTIARGQLPIIALLSAALALAGMIMLAFSILTITHGIGSNLALSLLMLVTAYRFPVMIGLLGILVLAGSVIGLYRSLLQYFET